MRFAQFSWILALPVALAVAWFRPARRPLRLVCLGLLVFILMQPQMRRLGSGLDLWVLVDRSASAADALAAHFEEMKSLLERSKSPEDRIFYVDYAEIAQIHGEADEIPSQKRQQTRTALAIQLALGRMKADRAARLLLLTDGYGTEPLTNIAQRLARQNVALDYRLVSSPGLTDYRLARFDLVPRAQAGERFLLDLGVSGEPNGSVTVEILRDGQSIGRAPLYITNGSASARFSDRLNSAGSHRYSARISAPNDSIPGNNFADRWIEIAGGARILLATNYTDDPLARVLSAQGFEVETVNNVASLHIGQLTRSKVVILNNVAAYQLPSEFLDALPFYVSGQGGGLLMVGGKQSFGSGGYFESSVDPLLPVSMELRTEQRKLATAMAVVLDRSGSMSAQVSGNLQKMDLANEGAARAIELLGSMDAVTVFAVDTEAHEIVPLTNLQSNRHDLSRVVRQIASGGGGICVPTGLRAARAQLLKAKAGQRHIILFADANDATQELGDYPSLIRDIRKDNMTISVIGLGSETDSGAKFLREVADLGGGRIFFNANPSELPGLFAQETVAVARSAFLEQPVGILPTAGWLELAAKTLPWPEQIDGYNLSYLKPGATGAAFSTDEYKAPLVAFWQRGAGRVAIVSFPLGGEFSERTRGWNQYGGFTQTVTRWLGGAELPPGLGLSTHLEGTELRLDLYYDSSWEEKLVTAPPRVVLSDTSSPEARELAWERLNPGHYSASVHLDPGLLVRGAVQAGDFVVPFGPIQAGSDAEWAMERSRLLELEQVSNTSGGKERVDLPEVWRAPRPAAFRDIRSWLVAILLFLFALDALLHRLGWQWQRRGKGTDSPIVNASSGKSASRSHSSLANACAADECP